jgi:hypothetical protein
MANTVPGGIYIGANGTYHNAEGEVIPEEAALVLIEQVAVIEAGEPVSDIAGITVLSEPVLTPAQKRAAGKAKAAELSG